LPDRRRKSRWPWRWVALAVVVGLPLVVAGILIDRDPLVLEAQELTSERAIDARGLVSRVRSEVLLASRPPGDLVITEDELNGVAALARRAMPRVSGRVNITPLGVVAALTTRIPATPFGSYVNVMVEWPPSPDGLEPPGIRVGSLRVPKPLALPITRFMLDALLGWGNGGAVLDMVAGLSPGDGQLTLAFRPQPDFAARMAEIRDRFRQTRDAAIRVSEPERVRAYYEQLVELAALTRPADRISLAMYLSPVFELAAQRSAGGGAVEENRAAIMALAIFFGSPRFELFTGPVIPGGEGAAIRRSSRTTLADRIDLRLHFVYSAALKVASDSGVSFALGEFKEMLDSAAGGSGFSFVDLAADRAGIRFAEEATASEDSARRLQGLLAAEMSEGLFFPSLDDLPEGLAEAEFRQAYTGLEAPAYRAAVAEIDRRLGELPLYR
jgi:hypothetical protein